MTKSDYARLQESLDKVSFEHYYRTHPNREVLSYYNLSDFYLDKLLSYFNIAHKTTEETYALIRSCIVNKSDEEKRRIETQRQLTRSKWPDEYKAEVAHKLSEVRLNRSEEQKQIQYKKFKETISNKSEEQLNETRLKRSIAATDAWEAKTDEQKDAFRKKMSEVYQNLPDSVKRQRVERIKATRDSLGIQNCFSNPVIKDKIRETNMQKYGVPYYCMTKDCRSALGGSSALSKPNIEFGKLLIDNSLSHNTEFVIDTYSYDFVVGSALIEINPTITHNATYSPFGEGKKPDYHYLKSKLARDNGYRCICVWDWDDVDKIIYQLKSRETVYARNCEIKEVDLNTTREYLNTYHLQGYARDNIRIGLFYDNKLVSIMTFGKPRYNKNYEYELIRYCSSYHVVGGAEKLFAYFIREYAPESIISYCDWSKFNGDVYTKLGFTFKNYSIGKHWYNMSTGVHITDNLLRSRGFDQLLGKEYGCFGKGTSNDQLMLEHGFVEVYDCGQASYEWNK